MAVSHAATGTDLRPDLGAVRQRAAALVARLARPDDEARVATLAQTFDGFPDRQIYNHLPASLSSQLASMSHGEPSGAARLLRLLIVRQVTDSLSRLERGEALPAPLRPVAVQTLQLLLRSVEAEADARYVLSDDRCIKDLQVSRLRLIPLGAQLLDPYQGYARRPFLTGGGLVGAPRAALALLRHGGNAPWHEFHTYDLAMRFFSAAGWEASLRSCIPLLRADAAVKGIFASAWWFDPALGALTPNMAFPYEVSARLGASFFPLPRDAQSDALAVYRSPERAALVASGRYVPRPYLMLLPRARLLALESP